MKWNSHQNRSSLLKNSVQKIALHGWLQVRTITASLGIAKNSINMSWLKDSIRNFSILWVVADGIRNDVHAAIDRRVQYWFLPSLRSVGTIHAGIPGRVYLPGMWQVRITGMERRWTVIMCDKKSIRPAARSAQELRKAAQEAWDKKYGITSGDRSTGNRARTAITSSGTFAEHSFNESPGDRL